jgi:leucyl/phenylalanyl-tRNA--protein transferase
MNQAFENVIQNCANQVRIEKGKAVKTWIAPQYIKEYTKFHKMGFAHSVEVWDGDELVGGLYGVLVNGVFSGESMFHKKDNASKFALLYLIERLKEKGFTWIDTQMVTEVVKSIGGKYISSEEHMRVLIQTQLKNKTERFDF